MARSKSAIALLFGLLLSSVSVQAVPAYPHPLEYLQSDGTKLKILMMGDEVLNWKTTTDGYTVLTNSDGDLEYAILNEKTELIPSGIIAKNKEQRTLKQSRLLQGIPKGLYNGKVQVESLKAASNASLQSKAQSLMDLSSSANSFPTKGNRKLLCILVGFPDKPFTLTKWDFEPLFNQIGYDADGATGSVRDYYLENSYGQLDLKVDVVGPYTASNTMYYYGNNVRGSAPELIREAILAADKDVNFTDYDNDGNGEVDGIYVVFAGYGEESGGGENALWSHSGLVNMTLDGVQLRNYSCSSELRGNSGNGISHIGVFAHEIGHLLGAVDLYDTDNTTGGSYIGTGNWDIMAGGVWNNNGATPAHHNGWTKVYRFNWAEVKQLSTPQSVVVRNAEEYSGEFYRVNTTTGGEFFLIENREKQKFDRFIPGSGLLMYHIHKEVSNGNVGINATHPQLMYPVSQNAGVLSGTAMYGNINDASCAWDGSGKTEFTDFSFPSMRSWVGANSYKPLKSIRRDSLSKTVCFDFMGFNLGEPPTIQAGNFNVTSIQEDQCTLHWTRGNGDRVLVIAKANDPIGGNPANGISFYADSNFYAGDLIDEDTYVIYDGTDTCVTVKNLMRSTTYHFAIFEYNISNSVYRTPGLIGSITTSGCSSCMPKNKSNLILGIERVNFHTIDKSSTSQTEYSDYKNLIAEVKTGQVYTLTVKLKSVDTYASVWIDWNRDCSFQCSEEYPLGSTNNSTLILSSPIPIPLNAIAGKLTMRIRTSFKSRPTPCGENEYSETEDYTLNLLNGCSPPSISCTGFTSVDILDNQATISWTRGNGDRVVVLARKGAPVETTLSNVLTLHASNSFGSGDSVSLGTYVVYDGTGTHVTVTDLMNLSVYHFAIFEYSVSNHCYQILPLTGAITTSGFNPCIPAKSEWEMYVSKVTINTINNISNTSLNGEGYSDYTKMVTELIAGRSYALTVNVNGGSNRVFAKAWVDWNRDNEFQQSEEYNLGSATNSALNLVAQIVPPANIANGHYLMRIRTRYNAEPTPCGTLPYSEAEDYTLKITGACAKPPTQQASGLTFSNIMSEQMTLKWTRGNGSKLLVIAKQVGSTDQLIRLPLYANSDFGLGTNVGNESFAVYEGTGNQVTVTGLEPQKEYCFSAFEINSESGCIMYPPSVGCARTLAPSGTYCVPPAPYDDKTGITKVVFNSLNCSSKGDPSYSDNSGISTTVLKGNSYDLSVNVNTSGNYTVYTKVWIDWNKDYFFSDDEMYNLGSSSNVADGKTSKSPLKIEVPNYASTGLIRMRIRAVYNNVPSPCASQHFSETEDYSIQVKNPIKNVWNGFNWSCLWPMAYHNVLIEGDYKDAGFTCNDLVISPGNCLQISSGSLMVNKDLMLKSDSSGTATLFENGLLKVAGTTSVEKFLPMDNCLCLSSPLSGGCTLTGADLFKYNEPGKPTFWEIVASNSLLSPMTGFLVQNSIPKKVVFTGVGNHTVNNGNLIKTDLHRTSTSPRPGFNLIGNPYPTFINVQSAINTSNTLDKSVWFLRENKVGTVVFDVLNTVSGVGTNNAGIGCASCLIPPMQAFWVRVKEDSESANLIFDNTMRVSEKVNDQSIPISLDRKHFIRIQVSGKANKDEAVLYKDAKAEDGYDAYDSPKISNNNPLVPEIHTFAGEKRVAINGMPSLTPGMIIKMGLKSESNDSLAIGIVNPTELDPTYRVILFDTLMNKLFDLTSGEVYRFVSVPVFNESRFKLIFNDATSLRKDSQKSIEQSITVHSTSSSKMVVCRKNCDFPGLITVLNAQGQLVIRTSMLGERLEIDHELAPGVYLLHLDENNIRIVHKFVHL